MEKDDDDDENDSADDADGGGRSIGGIMMRSGVACCTVQQQQLQQHKSHGVLYCYTKSMKGAWRVASFGSLTRQVLYHTVDWMYNEYMQYARAST